MPQHTESPPTRAGDSEASDPPGRFFFDVDGLAFETDSSRITGARIMALAGIDPSQGLVQCFEDGTQQTIAPDDVVELVPKPRFRKRPRFKRG